MFSCPPQLQKQKKVTSLYHKSCFFDRLTELAYGGHAGHREVERRQVGGEGGRAPRDHGGVG